MTNKEHPDGYYERETHIGLTSEQLATETRDILRVNKPSTDEIRESYLYPLLNLGVIEKVSSVIDGRSYIYFPVEDRS